MENLKNLFIVFIKNLKSLILQIKMFDLVLVKLIRNDVVIFIISFVNKLLLMKMKNKSLATSFAVAALLNSNVVFAD